MSKKYNNKKNKKLPKSIHILIAINIIIFTSIILYMPKIKLTNDTINMDVYSNYKEPGYKAYYLNKDLTNKVKIYNNINNKKIGKYYVNYKINNSIFSIKKKRIVNVVDKLKPEIILKGDKIINICPNKEYKEIGYIAKDNYDGDLTNKVTTKKYKKEIVYTVKDTSGNTTSKTRKISLKDIDKPVITLEGNNYLYLSLGKEYKEPGYKAIDNCDKDLTNKVKITSDLDNNKLGTYTINYEVSDSSGNKETIKRIVRVTNNEINNPGDGKIYLTFDDGPSAQITPKILDILKEEDIKATFFIINKDNNLNYLIKRQYKEGHTIALHSNTHRYNIDYSSNNAYIEGLSILSKKVYSLVGINPKIIRFPGGSSNTISNKYTKGVMSYLTKELTNKGYKYYDWNVDSEDAGSAQTKEDVYNNVINNLDHEKTNIVLLHDYDNNYKTLNALRDIIKYGKKNGYTFSNITLDTPQIKHNVTN